MIGRIFRGTTLFLSGVGVGAMGVLVVIDRNYAEIGEFFDKAQEIAADFKEGLETHDGDEGEPSKNGSDPVYDTTATEVTDGHPSDTAAQPAPEAPEQS